MVYGYIRVSAKDQNEARQMKALGDHNISPRAIYVDKQSGKDFDRPQYKHLLKKLRSGDLLIITSIDRLGRNYDEILSQWRIITKEKKVDILVLDFPLLDTRAKLDGQDLTGRFIADIVLQILAYVAQKERENIRQRQAEGIAVAKANGVRFGPKPMPNPPGFYEVKSAYESGALTVRQAAAKLGISKSSFYRRCQQKD